MPENHTSPPTTPRPRPRIPSGPRPRPAQRDSQQSFRSISSSAVPLASTFHSAIRSQASTTSLTSVAKLRELNDSPLDTLLDAEHDYTLSPDASPDLPAAGLPPVLEVHSPTKKWGSPIKSPERGRTFALISGKRQESPTRSQTLPQQTVTSPGTFSISRPSTPILSKLASPPTKVKPKPSKLNTLNLLNPSSSPTKPVSPGLKHWQQVRQHVMAPTPLEEKPSNKTGKKMNLVSKAAGKFGFRQAADHVMGYPDRRGSAMSFGQEIGGLSADEREEVARERRKFARDVKACLDACSLEETQRRLQRSDANSGQPRSANTSTQKGGAGSVHASQHNQGARYNFDPNFSSFAPLLMELHRHLPAARAKRLWSRTCPHHASILSELGVSFLPDGSSTDGERQQGLEVFGVVVRNWASDGAEEELGRWLWLCKALLLPDKQLRNRGLPLLASFLRADPDLPMAHDRPHTATAFQSLSMALLELLHSLETSGVGFEEHRQAVSMIIAELLDGDVIEMDPASVKEILHGKSEGLDRSGSGGLEKELFWLTTGHLLGQKRNVAEWLLKEGGQVLSRFLPPPLLHATPPLVLHLRSFSTAVCLGSMARLIDQSKDDTLLTSIWHVADQYILPDIEHLPDDHGVLAKSLAALFIHFDIASQSQTGSDDLMVEADPFKISNAPVGRTAFIEHRDRMIGMLKQDQWRSGFTEALKLFVSTADLHDVARLIRLYLSSKSLVALGGVGVAALLQRPSLSSSEKHFTDVETLLGHLQSAHPQLLYKPLFSLSASTNPTTLLANLKAVRAISGSLGSARFWTLADPQMVVIVLMGDMAPKQNKGKGKEGEKPIVSVKLGRYACLVELILALQEFSGTKAKDKLVKAFVEALESRLGVVLDAEQQQGSLPALYRALLCRLFLRLRMITSSVRKASWQRLIIPWLLERPSNRITDDTAAALRSTYTSLEASSHNKNVTPSSSGRAQAVARRNTLSATKTHQEELLRTSLDTSASALLVAIHACLIKEDWLALLPYLWEVCGQANEEMQAVTFLLMKCGEIIPDDWEDLIMSDLYSMRSQERLTALRKLSLLYGWRFQILSQFTLTDRRGPVFHFSARTLEFVATEIGSPHWIPPHDVQDAALKKFGTTLPLELRQRLMELGWSEDETIVGTSDWEQIPVSSLPSLQFDIIGEGGPSAPSSPMKSLARHTSNASGSSHHGKRRKAVFAPVLLSVISEQASVLAHDPDSLVGSASRELLRLLERDDHAMFLRPFTDGLGLDFRKSLSSLNAVLTVATPAFAYSALNSITGYLKTILRTDPHFALYAPALATISVLVPHVSEVSLRDIRKHKAEQVLLPASIHEEEGGYKLHTPWREGIVEVQTAQLLILTEILKVSPREVYLFKKMLSNLPIQASIPHRPFSRAWLVLIHTLFATVNRNYNDRAELRHFLSNVGNILGVHGTTDVLVVSHALRVFILCSARFRRLFGSMGISTCLGPILELYAQSSGHTAIKDAIEYSARSFYRIHQETFVYQTCVVISESNIDARSAYSYLACLSTINTPSSGVASGIRGLNDKEEMEALVQMLLGPELTFAEIGTDAAERAAGKMASIDLDGTPFPRMNIVKLLVTVIAANPGTKRAVDFLRLFAGLVPYFEDAPSLDLVREGVEALGVVILKGKVGEDAVKSMFNPGEEDSKPDWNAAKREYILLVQSFARAGGLVSPGATKRTLEMVHDLLRKQPELVGPAAASILKEFAKTHLHASGSRPVAFLRDIAPLFRLFISVVDFSGLLEEITDLIIRAGYDLDQETMNVIIDAYVGPAVRMLASAAEDNLAFIVPLRGATVDILAAAVFLRGDALGPLERAAPNPSLLASLVFPLCMSLQSPTQVDREAVYDAIWIRLLRYVTNIGRSKATRSKPLSPQAVAATSMLSLQIVKIIALQADVGISKTPGLWNYIARHLEAATRGGDGAFLESETISPRLIDWTMWSTLELLVLHKSPLMIEMRHLIQTSLALVSNNATRSAPSSPGEGGRFSLSPNIGRARIPSARSPSVFQRIPSGGSGAASPISGLRSPSGQVSATGLTPDTGHVGKGGHSRMPSQHLSPVLGHGRMPSASSIAVPGSARPSFADLSARRVSRPAFAMPGGSSMPYRFPSSQPVRQLAGERGGGAIVHLLGAPNQVLGATSAAIPTLGVGNKDDAAKILRDLRVGSAGLQEAARRGVRSCKVVFGLGDDMDEDVQVWSTQEAIAEIAEQTRLLIEEEFRDLFIPPTKEDWQTVSRRMSQLTLEEKEGYSLDQLRSFGTFDEKDGEAEQEEEVEMMMPKFELSIAR